MKLEDIVAEPKRWVAIDTKHNLKMVDLLKNITLITPDVLIIYQDTYYVVIHNSNKNDFIVPIDDDHFYNWIDKIIPIDGIRNNDSLQFYIRNDCMEQVS